MSKRKAILFSKCAGLNDNLQTTAVEYNAEGITDIASCVNMSVTSDGKLVKPPTLNTAVSSTAAIDALVAGARMFVQTGTALKEFDGVVLKDITASPVFTPGTKAAYISTPLDVRVSLPAANYKVVGAATSAVLANVGSYNGPATSVQYAKMPPFAGGFVYNAKLYTHLGKFLQHSADYNYDLFDLGNGHIGHTYSIIQSGQIPGCILVTHEVGVSIYLDNGPGRFKKVFVPCRVIAGTLCSGYIEELSDYAHIFMCYDGIRAVGSDGKVVRITADKLESAGALNTSYNTAALHSGKYLAFGNTVCVEYDFSNKAVMLRATSGVVTSCVWANKLYVGNGLNISTFSTADNTDSTPSSFTLPYNDFGVDQTKQIRFLYFTGKITGYASVIVRNQFGQSVIKDVSNIGYVQNFKISGLRKCKGNKLAVGFSSKSGAFKLEELRVEYYNCSSRG